MKQFELRASNAHRWMVCHGQPAAVSGMRDAPTSAADKGTVAHALLEVMLRLDVPTDEIDRFADRPLLRVIDNRPADHILVDEEMMTGVAHALDYVRGYITTHPGATYEIEQALDATPFVGYETGGTSDVVLRDLPRELVILDYKNGVQHVDHTDNDQLHIYALGALNLYSTAIDTRTAIRMVIVQPNSRQAGGPVREIVYTYDDLMLFAKKAAAAAKAAHRKNPPRVAGEHCTFCRAAGACRTYADYALQAAALEFEDLTGDLPLQDPRNMKPAEMARVLAGAAMLRSWLVNVEDEAIRQLLARHNIPGFKLVNSSPHRRWDDQTKVIELLKPNKQLYEELVPRVPLSPSRMEHRLARKRDGNPVLLSKLEHRMTRNPVEPRIAPLDDSRPEYQRGNEFCDELKQ